MVRATDHKIALIVILKNVLCPLGHHGLGTYLFINYCGYVCPFYMQTQVFEVFSDTETVHRRVKELEHSRTVQLSFMQHLNNMLLVVKSSERWLEKVLSLFILFNRTPFFCSGHINDK